MTTGEHKLEPPTLTADERYQIMRGIGKDELLVQRVFEAGWRAALAALKDKTKC
jgi:hypothetical protein